MSTGLEGSFCRLVVLLAQCRIMVFLTYCERLLCILVGEPVCALSEYVASTSRVVNRPRRPFVSSRCSSRVISKYSIFFLLREVILYCRQHRRCCGSHSFPDLATSSAFFKNGFLSNVLIAPSLWSTTVFASFSLKGYSLYVRRFSFFRFDCSRRTLA